MTSLHLYLKKKFVILQDFHVVDVFLDWNYVLYCLCSNLHKDARACNTGSFCLSAPSVTLTWNECFHVMSLVLGLHPSFFCPLTYLLLPFFDDPENVLFYFLVTATISIFCSNFVTWDKLLLSLLLNTRYLFKHSINHSSASPSLLMCCSIVFSQRKSPQVNSIVHHQTHSPKSFMCSPTLIFCSTEKAESIGITRRKVFGLGGFNLWLSPSGILERETQLLHPGISITVSFLPSTTSFLTSDWVDLLWPHNLTLTI